MKRMPHLDELTVQAGVTLLNEQGFIDKGFGLCPASLDNFKIVKVNSFITAISTDRHVVADCGSSSSMFEKSLSKGSFSVSNVLDVRITRTCELFQVFNQKDSCASPLTRWRFGPVFFCFHLMSEAILSLAVCLVFTQPCYNRESFDLSYTAI